MRGHEDLKEDFKLIESITSNQVIKLTPEEEAYVKRLSDQGVNLGNLDYKIAAVVELRTRKKLQQLQQLLEQEMIHFDFKFNKCLLGCHRIQTADCFKKCERSQTKVNKFIRAKVDGLANEFSKCQVQAAESITQLASENKCQTQFHKGIDLLCDAIRHQMKYYQ